MKFPMDILKTLRAPSEDDAPFVVDGQPSIIDAETMARIDPDYDDDDEQRARLEALSGEHVETFKAGLFASYRGYEGLYELQRQSARVIIEQTRMLSELRARIEALEALASASGKVH